MKRLPQKKRPPLTLMDALEIREMALRRSHAPAPPVNPLQAVVTDRAAAFLAQPEGTRDFGAHCWYCGLGLVRLSRQERRAYRRGRTDRRLPENLRTRDHQVPVSRGGGGAATGNVVSACGGCNGRKAARTVSEYRAYERAAGRPSVFWAEMVQPDEYAAAA
jgi:5-methylcytosine-specific restriction endonuclease McrA